MKNNCYLLHSNAVKTHQTTCRSPAPRMKTADMSTPRDLQRTLFNPCKNPSAGAKPTDIKKTNYFSQVAAATFIMHVQRQNYKDKLQFSRLLASAKAQGTKKHPGGSLHSLLNTLLQRFLKSEISAHQRGQYGHRHTGGKQNCN